MKKRDYATDSGRNSLLLGPHLRSTLLGSLLPRVKLHGRCAHLSLHKGRLRRHRHGVLRGRHPGDQPARPALRAQQQRQQAGDRKSRKSAHFRREIAVLRRGEQQIRRFSGDLPPVEVLNADQASAPAPQRSLRALESLDAREVPVE
eukprot:scaffold2908_cov257-Pinguiococcus_pyrenoidosus.AAC.15